MTAGAASLPGADTDRERVRLTERLAILDEIHDEIAHDLALASIHLALLDPGERHHADDAQRVAGASCRRALHAVRRARARTGAHPAARFDPEAVPRDLGHLAALAAACGATAEVETPLPPPGRLEAGLLLTAARVAEAFLRLTAGCAATVSVRTAPRLLVVDVRSSLPAGAWSRAAPDLDRVRERTRFFDGSLRAEARGAGSRAVAELPLL
jgi:hypothetical protein